MVKNSLLMLAVVGLFVPFFHFIPAGIRIGFSAVFYFLFANPNPIFFAADLVITTIVFSTYLYQEARRQEIKSWGIYVAASLFVGLSFALPLFLYLREKSIV